MGKTIMVQGTASSVGKSLLCTALCRIFTQDGYHTAPFKAQNMSLNSYVTLTGEEMGRAQVVQAEACGKIPEVRMNPVLLKPSSDHVSQIIVNGKVFATMDAVSYDAFKPKLRKTIKQVFSSLAAENDIVVLEGAGSPAEINLKARDIVNMEMARLADSPVLLVGDIDRGGVFASLLGTLLLLTEEERQRVKGLIINKFRGDISLLLPGIAELEKRTGIAVLGVLPMLPVSIEQEDSAEQKYFPQKKDADLEIAVLSLPYLSNFTDINALALEPGVNIRFVGTSEEFGTPDIVILPGTKSTMEALCFLRRTGLYQKVKAYGENGGFLFGICGGYQLLGRKLTDRKKVESETAEAEGLGLLPVDTFFCQEKTMKQNSGIVSFFREQVTGYEIHMGQEERGDTVPPFIVCEETVDGAVAENGKIIGTYFHGIFDNGAFTRQYLNFVREKKGKKPYQGELLFYQDYRQRQYDSLAEQVRKHLEIEKIYGILEAGIEWQP